MPYLKQDLRDEIEQQIGLEHSLEYLTSLSEEHFAGTVNYINYKFFKRNVERKGNKYWRFAIWVGTMLCCVLEVYRRFIAPYEDKAIQNPEQGDVK